MKRRQIYTVLFFVCMSFFFSCKTIVLNSLSSTLAGANQRGIPAKKKANDINPMIAITGETDITLVADFFPTILKMYEVMQVSNPKHLGLMTMTASLNIMYANAFVQTPAEVLPNEQFDEQLAEFNRAKLHYLRGRDLALSALDGRHKGFREDVLSGDADRVTSAVAKLDKNDIDSAYWAGAGWLGAFSLDPLNPDLLSSLSSPVAILEKGASLNEMYNDGSIWDLLCNFYASAPAEFGGDAERALECHKKALIASGEKAPGPYVTYAQAVCVQSGDKKGFEQALEKALAINPDDSPETRLMTTIMQKKAELLLYNKDNYFFEW